MPNKVLILFAHPVLERSRVNRRLRDAVSDVTSVTVHDLYEVYPLTLHVITADSAEHAYRRNGYNRFTLRELLTPYDQTAYLCSMRFLAPLVVYDALRMTTDADVAPYGALYRNALERLRDGQLDLEQAALADTLNPLVSRGATA